MPLEFKKISYVKSEDPTLFPIGVAGFQELTYPLRLCLSITVYCNFILLARLSYRELAQGV